MRKKGGEKLDMEKIKEAYEKKSERREKLRTEVLEKVFEALEDLSDKVVFDEAYIFGSVAAPRRFREDSDVDIAFKGLDKDRLFFAVGFLSNALERDVNIVEIERIRFRDKIERVGLRWKKE